MISFPNCKINLGLSITGRRDDGYHNIDSVFYPVNLQDALEFVVSQQMKFEKSGISIPGESNHNLIIKAYDLLKNDFSQITSLHIHLHKKIPIGGGLGGGSSNGSFMLKMLNDYFELGLHTDSKDHSTGNALHDYALKLGSDCPFFILNQACHASGRGEILEPIELNLSDYQFLLVSPGIHIQTSSAFQQIHPATPQRLSYEIVQDPIDSWKDTLHNQFEDAMFNLYPLLSQIKSELYDVGCIYASMSGSGSTMYGIFRKEKSESVNQKIGETKTLKDLSFYFI